MASEDILIGLQLSLIGDPMIRLATMISAAALIAACATDPKHGDAGFQFFLTGHGEVQSHVLFRLSLARETRAYFA